MEAVIFLVIVTFVIWLILWLIDLSGTRHLERGVVMEKKARDGQDIYINYGNNSGGHFQKFNGTCMLSICISNDIVSTSASEEVYKNLKEGDNVTVEYSQCRLLKSKVYIRRIHPV